MATISTSAIIDEMASRLRDTSSFAHPRAVVLDILSRVQRVLNLGLKFQLTSATFAPTAMRCLYQMTEVAADVGKVVAVRDAGRDLAEIMWDELPSNDAEWLRAEGPQPEAFASIGRDLLVITPMQRIVPPSLTVVYATQTAALVDDVANFPVIPDEYVSLLEDITEAILLLRGRIFTPESALPELVKRIQEALGVGIVEQDNRHAQG